jgi:hypothetical protein
MRKMILTNELTLQLGKQVMLNAKDLSWRHDPKTNRFLITLSRKRDYGYFEFPVPIESVEGDGGPYVVLDQETKAMIVLFLA